MDILVYIFIASAIAFVVTGITRLIEYIKLHNKSIRILKHVKSCDTITIHISNTKSLVGTVIQKTKDGDEVLVHIEDGTRKYCKTFNGNQITSINFKSVE